MGIQSTNEMDVCCPNHFFFPDPDKEKERFITYNKVFVLLIPTRSAPSSMPPIDTSVVGLNRNTDRWSIGLTFRLILESTIQASEVALIGDTRQKELLYVINFTFNQRRFFFISIVFFIPNRVSFS